MYGMKYICWYICVGIKVCICMHVKLVTDYKYYIYTLSVYRYQINWPQIILVMCPVGDLKMCLILQYG